MDPVTAVVAAVYGLPVLGAGGYALARIRRRNALRRRLIALGLREVGGRETRFDGKLDGVTLQVTPLADASVAVRAAIFPPLDLSLVVLPLGHAGIRVGERSVSPDEEFNQSFECYGAEPARVWTLLQDHQLRVGLTDLAALSSTMYLWDGRLQCWLPHAQLHDPAGPLALITGIARGIDAARARVPVAADKQLHASAWQAFAPKHRLQLSHAPLGMHGTLRGQRVWALLVAVGPGAFRVDVLASFREPLGVDLRIETPGFERFLAGAPPDTELEVHVGSDEARSLVAGRLMAQLRSTQRQLGALLLSDQFLYVRVARTVEPDAALLAMERVAELAYDLEVELAQLRRASGPYRG